MSQSGVAATGVQAGGEWLDWVGSDAWYATSDAAIPMLPSLALEVADIALNPDAPVTRITALVSKDPVLATKVIQLANSAFSASATDVTSIQEAVVRMGTTAIRNIVTASCLTSMMEAPGIYGNRGRDLIDHSIGTAYLARLVAEYCGEPPDDAFLYGLLHDLGKLLILRLGHMPATGIESPSEQVIDQFLTEQHALFGGHMLAQWHLPHVLHDPIVWHHQPDEAVERPLAAAVAYAANRLAHRYGFGCDRQDFDPLADPAFARVGIDQKRLARIDDRAPGLFQIARSIAG